MGRRSIGGRLRMSQVYLGGFPAEQKLNMILCEQRIQYTEEIWNGGVILAARCEQGYIIG